MLLRLAFLLTVLVVPLARAATLELMTLGGHGVAVDGNRPGPRG